MKRATSIWMLVISAAGAQAISPHAQAGFRQAPGAASQAKTPFASGDPEAARAGAASFARNCASCHGASGAGAGNVPNLKQGPAQQASDGELAWFIKQGSSANGMPAFDLSELERWQLAAYIKRLPKLRPPEPHQPPPSAAAEDDAKLPAPAPPFTDYRFEKPSQMHLIRSADFPEPKPATSVGNGPEIAPRPAGAWPQVPAGFKVELYAEGLDNPRLLRTAPNGDVFLAESDSGKIRVFRGLGADGKPQTKEVFAQGLKRPYGIAFFPPGPAPKWIYVGDTDAIVRFSYKAGDLRATGPAAKIADLPSGDRGHWTRDLAFSVDGQKLFVAVGSGSNVDDPDSTPGEKNRADILVMSPEGKDARVYAYGIRNAGGGLAIQPGTGTLWCSVNERDGLGDNLVADYITHVEEGGFYGWPWWYIGGHQDPRHKGKRPELKSKLIAPDVLLQAHHASLQLAFYDGKQFPAAYRGDIFSSQHGSWSRSVRTGYEVVRVPLHGKGKATGEYEDFMTGFVIDSHRVWGRPVGATVAADGALLVSDDGSNSIWRVSYVGKRK